MLRAGFFIIGIIMSFSANSESTFPSKKLALCPNTPNCVSSQASDLDHYIEPFKIKGDPEKVWVTFKKILGQQNRTKISEANDSTLHAEATSLIFRFVDDVHAILEPETQLIHVRSASRVGYSDFGVNRKRIESLRKQLQQLGVVE